MNGRVHGVVFADGVDRSDAINAAGEKYGIPPIMLVGGAIMESGLGANMERWGTWPDVSFGPWQQTVRYAPIGNQSNTIENVDYVRDILLNDFDQALDIAAPQYAEHWANTGGNPLETYSRYNGGAGMDFADNPNAGHIQASWDAAQQYLEADMPDTSVVYNPNVPHERQNQDWVCSIRTAASMLHTIGDWITAGELQTLMVNAGLVTPEKGLRLGDGSGLAAFLQERTGLQAHYGFMDFDWLLQHAGTQPIGIGSGTLYHWVGVLDVLPDEVLQLNNPAAGYRGLGNTMTRDEFNQWAPWACVWLDMPDQSQPEQPEQPAEEDPAVIAELEAQVAALKEQLDAANSNNGAVGHDVIRPAVERLQAELGKQKAARRWEKVAGELIDALRPYVIE